MDKTTRVRSSDLYHFQGVKELTMQMDEGKIKFIIHQYGKDVSISIGIDSIITMFHLGIMEANYYLSEKKFWQRSRKLLISGLPFFFKEASFMLSIKKGVRHEASIDLNKEEFIKKLFSIWPRKSLEMLSQKINLGNHAMAEGEEITAESLFNELVAYQKLLDNDIHISKLHKH